MIFHRFQSHFHEKYDTRTANKQTPSDKTMEFLKEKFRYEVQLYRFIRTEFKKKLLVLRAQWKPDSEDEESDTNTASKKKEPEMKLSTADKMAINKEKLKQLQQL